MVNSEELRKWANEYRIRQKAPSDEWPSAHQVTFEHIRHICRTNLQDYNTCSFKNSGEPWKRHNVNKAVYLSKKASFLSERSANESAWRHGIEGIIVKRLSDEVACPRCSYKLWRSEVEFGRDGTALASLDSQFYDSKTCECAAEHRSGDPYEVGASQVFEELIEGDVVHNDPGKLRLTQKPDRIIGLQETDAMSRLLDQSPHNQFKQHVSRIRNLVQMTPSRNRSKQQSKPLLLPFLVIEAKSHKAQESFSDIQTQTALPIRSFLNSQWELWKHGSRHCSRPEPLVWFLAYRGSDWKIYACYKNRDSTSETAYTIHHLQSGDLMTREGALHLILIFDYIADWAKESYRPSVLKQLTSLATGQDFDKVTLDSDSRVIAQCKPVPLLTASAHQDVQMEEEVERSDSESVPAEEHSNVNFLHMPTSEYGTIRPMNTAVFRCTGLRITEDNITDFLPSGLGDQTIGACARELLHDITSWEDILIVTAVDLGDLEVLWTGGEPSGFHSYDRKSDAEFYVKFQYRCYIDLSWRTIRELSYLAVSPSAMPVLKSLAASQRKVATLYSIPERLLQCSGATLRETMSCIRSGSQWQVLRSAVVSTAFYLHPCSAVRDSHMRTVAYFTLHYVRSTQFSTLIGVLGKHFSSRHECFTTCSVWRSTDSDVWIEDEPHDNFNCRRCLASCQNIYALRDWDGAGLSSRSASGAILVSALRQEDGDEQLQHRHALCLYLCEKSPALLDGIPFSTTIEKLASSGYLYHTILHGQPLKDSGTEAVLWNLPLPYRQSTRRQRYDISRWVHDLTGHGSLFLEKPPTGWVHIWVHQQILLFFLRKQMNYEDADAAFRAFRNESRALYRSQQNLMYGDPNLPLSSVQLSKFWAKVYEEGDDCGAPCE